ncbi:MAG: hypothetical protein P9L94_10990 [Candidatus Hinthialibacter antarcticus]|nr:hypothetical protein [Candidatus Hinthialibacter antarcticus]
MKSLPHLLIWLSILSIIIGIVFKVAQIDLGGTFGMYPVRPLSFVNFAEVILLLSIALLLKNRSDV